jgi:hypothetical protein
MVRGQPAAVRRRRGFLGVSTTRPSDRGGAQGQQRRVALHGGRIRHAARENLAKLRSRDNERDVRRAIDKVPANRLSPEELAARTKELAGAIVKGLNRLPQPATKK